MGSQGEGSRAHLASPLPPLLDDCKNIANIMKTLAYQEGFIFKRTSKPF